MAEEMIGEEGKRHHPRDPFHFEGWESISSAPLPPPPQQQSDGYDDYSVFPPSHHEGLHPSFDVERFNLSEEGVADVDDCDDKAVLLQDPHAEVDEGEEKEVLPPDLNSGFEQVKRVVVWGMGLVRGCGEGDGTGAVVSFAAVAGIAAAVAAVFYLGRRRRQRQREKELAFLLLREKDQRISDLLQQIALVKEIFAIRYDIPVLKKSDTS